MLVAATAGRAIGFDVTVATGVRFAGTLTAVAGGRVPGVVGGGTAGFVTFFFFGVAGWSSMAILTSTSSVRAFAAFVVFTFFGCGSSGGL